MELMAIVSVTCTHLFVLKYTIVVEIRQENHNVGNTNINKHGTLTQC